MTEATAPAATAPAATAPAAAPVPKDERNGVTRPKAGTQTGMVWDICDELSKAANAPAERKPVVDRCTAAGINPSTAATQYGKWRKYHGLVNERAAVSPKATATPAASEAPMEAPEQDAEAA